MKSNRDIATASIYRAAQDERDKMICELAGSWQAFLDTVRDLSALEWRYKPGSDRWSIAECAAHLALSEDFLSEIVMAKAAGIHPSRERFESAEE